MKVPFYRSKKTYTRLAFFLSLLSTVCCFGSLLSTSWFTVRDAPFQSGLHQLRSYGLISACYASRIITRAPGDPEVSDARCAAYSNRECYVQLLDDNNNEDPSVASESPLIDIPLGAIRSCRLWKTATALHVNASIFFTLSTLLASFTAFSISGPLLVGVATAHSVATTSLFTVWLILQSSRNFQIQMPSSRADPELIDIFASASSGFGMVTAAWVCGAISFAIELWAALWGRTKGYRTAALYYDEDDPETDAPSSRNRAAPTRRKYARKRARGDARG